MIAAEQITEIMLPDVTLRLIEPHLFSPSAPGENTNTYDEGGALSFYDKVACNRLYNRLVWGYSTSDYHTLCREALTSSTAGWVLDAGCGSLAFTAKTYAGYTARPVVFLDQSLTLLTLAKSRLAQLHGQVPDNAVFLHGDVLNLPFKPQSFGAIIALNLLHVLPDIKHLLQNLRQVLLPGGAMLFTTLIENHRPPPVGQRRRTLPPHRRPAFRRIQDAWYAHHSPYPGQHGIFHPLDETKALLSRAFYRGNRET